MNVMKRAQELRKRGLSMKAALKKAHSENKGRKANRSSASSGSSKKGKRKGSRRHKNGPGFFKKLPGSRATWDAAKAGLAGVATFTLVRTAPAIAAMVSPKAQDTRIKQYVVKALAGAVSVGIAALTGSKPALWASGLTAVVAVAADAVSDFAVQPIMRKLIDRQSVPAKAAEKTVSLGTFNDDDTPQLEATPAAGQSSENLIAERSIEAMDAGDDWVEAGHY